MKFKQYIIKRKLTQSHKQKDIARGNINFHDARSIGILFCLDNTTDFRVIKDFIQKLIREGKIVNVMVYIADTKIYFSEKDIEIFYDKDISITGKIENEALLEFINMQFDYLFAIHIGVRTIVNYVLQKSKAKCRVGFYNEYNSTTLELMIESLSGQNLETSLNQLLYYVKVMKS